MPRRRKLEYPSSGFHPIPPDDYVAWFGEVARNIECAPFD